MSTQVEREIHEQPQALARTLEGARGATVDLAREVRRRGIEWVMIAARGTSDHAAVYAGYLLAAFNGLPVSLATPSLYTWYRKPPRLASALVLGISQSGQSEDVVEVLAEAQRQGALTAAVTNEPGSPLTGHADHVLALATGPERAVAATKTYTSTLAALALLSAELEQDADRLGWLERLPGIAEDTLARCAERVAAAVQAHAGMERCVILSRGYNYATAMEIALKMKELAYVTTVPYSTADFMHGPVAILEPGYPVLLVAPSGEMAGQLAAIVPGLRERGAEVLAIGNSAEVLDAPVEPLPIAPAIPEWLSPAAAVLPGQLLAVGLSAAKGHDPDRPRGLSKVTVTR
jgi:glucosamine--fructose-6-phosphate aminotransferase (isomerizing)